MFFAIDGIEPRVRGAHIGREFTFLAIVDRLLVFPHIVDGPHCGIGGTGITRRPFRDCGHCLGLCQGAKAAGNRHGEAGGNGFPLGVSLGDSAGIGRIGLRENQLITDELHLEPLVRNGMVV